MTKSGFLTLLYDFLLILSLFEGILVIFGGSWALFEARSWGEVGSLFQLQAYINQRLLKPKEEVQNRKIMKNY
jgi:hypothetical protein